MLERANYLIILLFFFLWCPITLFAQDKAVADSLEKLLPGKPDDSLKVKLLNDLSWEFTKSNSEKALKYGNQAMELAKGIKYKRGEARSSINLGNIYYLMGNYPVALHYYIKSQDHYEEMKDKKGLSNSLLAIGNIYFAQENYDQALDYQLKSLKLREEMKDKAGISGSYTNIGNIYFAQKNYPAALEYQLKSLQIKEDLGDRKGMSSSYGNIGNNYYEQGNYKLALEYQMKAMEIRKEMGNKSGLSGSFINIGNIYEKQEKYDQAIENYLKGIETARSINYNDALKSGYAALASAYRKKKDFQKALDAYERFTGIKDTLLNESSNRQMNEMTVKYETEKKEKEIALLTKDKEIRKLEASRHEAIVKKQQTYIYSILTGLVLVILLAWIIFNRYQIKKKANYDLEIAYNQIEEKNKDITDSIRYAKRIQEAILPSDELIKQGFPDSFICYIPKAIVSGDFYWLEKSNGKFLLAVVDCTGHGVPGAFMSLVGHNYLRMAVNEKGMEKPSDILNFLNEGVIEIFRKNSAEGALRDGMDIALCSFDLKNLILQYSGANNPVWIFRDNGNGPELIEFKATKQPIGSFMEGTPKPFTNNETEIRKGDTVYMFTDGYADQFGGNDGKKFKYRRLKSLLLSIQEKNMGEQLNIVTDNFEEWKKGYDQVDDILVMGIKI